MLSSLSMCISLIPFLISEKLSNLKSKFDDINKANKFQKYLFIIIAAFLDFAGTLINIFFRANNINLWILDFIIISIFSHFILKINLYRHHYFSMVLILICSFSLYPLQIIKYRQSIKIIKDILVEISLCASLVINKYAMDYKFCSPFELCFYIGFFELILIGILHIFFYFFKYKYINDFKEYKSKVNLKEIYIVALFLLLNFIYNLTQLVAIKKYNSFISLIIIVVTEIGLLLLKSNKIWEICIIVLIACIALFTTLAFNEIIEINCLGLQKKTKKNLELIAKSESDQLYNRNTEDETQKEIEDYKFELVPVDYQEDELSNKKIRI